MAINKYIFGMIPIYEAMKNMVELKMHPEEIARVAVSKYRLEIRLYKMPIDMMIEFYQSIAEGMWFQKYGNHDYITKDKEKICLNKD